MMRRAKELTILARTVLAAGPPCTFSGLARSLRTSAAAAGQPPKDDGWIPPAPAFFPHQHQWHDKYCRQRNIMPVGPRFPALATDVYVAPSAVVAGDVDILDGVTIMHGSVLRGDLNNISIGAFSSVQENCVIHAARNGPTGLPAKTSIGMSVTIGAGSLLRSCQIEDMAVIGERSIVMEGSLVSSKAILLPGTVVPPAKMIPPKEVWGGNPAAFVRKITHDEEIEVGQLAASHEKWRDLYSSEELPYGNAWKRAEALDPAEDRLFPDETPKPDWVPDGDRTAE